MTQNQATTLKDYAAEALALGRKQLEAAGTPVTPFLYLDGAIVVLADAQGTSQLRDAVEAILRSKATEAGRYALVVDSRISDGNGKPVDALIVNAGERGQPRGLALIQRYQPKGMLKPLQMLGAVEEGEGENLLIARPAPAADSGTRADPLAGLDPARREMYLKLAKDLALQIYNSLVASQAPEFKPVNPGEFGRLDLRFYDRTELDFLKAGFRTLGDFEPVHITRAQNRRDLYRMFVAADGVIAAVISHMKPNRPALLMYWLLRIMRKWPKDVHAIELQSELSDGSFLLTNNAGQQPIEFPPTVEVLSLPVGTRVQDVLKVHRDRLGKRLGTDVRPVVAASIADLVAAEQRQEKLKREHRLSNGGVSEQELRNLTKEHYPYLALNIRRGLAELMAFGGKAAAA